MFGLIFLRRRALRHVRHQADVARDNREYAKAACFYEKVLSYTPNDAAIHVQCGHMLKEAGELERAEQHYNKARVLMPNDPDLVLQFGHFYKVAGRLGEAELSYRRAAELMPGAAEPADELTGLLRNRWSNGGEHASQRFTAPPSRKSGRGGSGLRRHARADAVASQLARGKTARPIRRAASVLYEKTLEAAPNEAALQIKCAHLFEF